MVRQLTVIGLAEVSWRISLIMIFSLKAFLRRLVVRDCSKRLCMSGVKNAVSNTVEPSGCFSMGAVCGLFVSFGRDLRTRYVGLYLGGVGVGFGAGGVRGAEDGAFDFGGAWVGAGG